MAMAGSSYKVLVGVYLNLAVLSSVCFHSVPCMGLSLERCLDSKGEAQMKSKNGPLADQYQSNILLSSEGHTGGRVQEVVLSKNRFSASAADNIISADQGSMRHLLSSDNQITVAIPPTIGQMKQLTILDLSRNKLTGSVPSTLALSTSLEVLDLSENHLSGELDINLAEDNGLKSVHLSNNSLSGEFPPWLKNCPKLEILDLSHNGFAGEIPKWIGERCTSLKILDLRSNNFTGEIPIQLSNLSSLQVLDLAHNYLFGSIPQSFRNLKAMTKKHVLTDTLASGSGYYQEKIAIVMKGREDVYFTRTLSLVNSLDLSANNLSGEIPQALTKLIGLKVLNLSHNQLVHYIPKDIGLLTELESLDLSYNLLSGEVPSSLGSITSLSKLNLSYNKFIGKIPLGPQLQTFDQYSYIGNLGLCGNPMEKQCPNDRPNHEGKNGEEEDQSNLDMSCFYMTMGLGFVVGFWGFCGILVFKTSWRHLF